MEVAGEDLFAHGLILDAFEEMGLEEDVQAQTERIDALQKALIERYQAQQEAAETAEPEAAKDTENSQE